MIGCPLDIVEEVQIAKDVLFKWSCMNAEARNIVLLPLHWSDNAYPDYGQHPQKMLDRQIVDKSDMLVCIFNDKLNKYTTNLWDSINNYGGFGRTLETRIEKERNRFKKNWLRTKAILKFAIISIRLTAIKLFKYYKQLFLSIA